MIRPSGDVQRLEHDPAVLDDIDIFLDPAAFQLHLARMRSTENSRSWATLSPHHVLTFVVNESQTIGYDLFQLAAKPEVIAILKSNEFGAPLGDFAFLRNPRL